MADKHRIEGPTPSGGAYAVACYLKSGIPTDKENADTVEIVEFDQTDKELSRTYGTIAPANGPGAR